MEGPIYSKTKLQRASRRTPGLRVVWAVLLFLCFCVFILLNPYFGSFRSAYFPSLQYDFRLQKWLHSRQNSASAGSLLSFLKRSTGAGGTPGPKGESGIDAFSKSENEVVSGLSSHNETLKEGRLSVRRAIKYFRWSHAAAAQLQRAAPSTIYFLFYEDREKKSMKEPRTESKGELEGVGRTVVKDKEAGKKGANTEDSNSSLAEGTPSLLSSFEDVAVDFSSKPLVHVSVPRTLMHHWEYIIPEDWAQTLPLAMIVEMDQGWRKYVLKDRNLTYEKLRNFEEHYFEGVLLPSLRSEPASSVSESGGGLVVPLVGETFKRKVINARKDALVFFYAPWCGFCKMFETKWDELAAEFAGISSVRFFKMDVTKNDIDHPHTRVERVPYVAFYRRDQKLEPPLKMNHSIEDFVTYGKEYILENAACKEINLEHGIDCFYEDLPGHEF